MSLEAWYPLLVAASIPVPATEIVQAPFDLTPLLDGEEPEGWTIFVAELEAAARRIGYPVFLRTGHGSGKHEFVWTCFVPEAAALANHVAALVEWSALVDFLGLPTDVWAVREMLPVESTFTAFRGFPVSRERRYFIRDGRVIGHHPYWPPAAIEDPSVQDWRPRLDALNTETPEEIAVLTDLSKRVGAAIPGAWSVDWLWSPGRGWICIDMAWAERSFVWADYPSAPAP